MVTINYAFKEVVCKIVYYGPGLSGKTTNLQWVFEKIPSQSRGELISLATETDRTLYFDFLPINLGTIHGLATKFQLYTVPGQVFYNATRKLVLRGVDGIVFVADSQLAKMDENLESLNNLRENLKEYGYNLKDIPFVLQYNKRDLTDIAEIEQLQQALNERGVPYFEAVACQGKGVFDTLKSICKLVLDKARSQSSEQVSKPEPVAVAAESVDAKTEPEAVKQKEGSTTSFGATEYASGVTVMNTDNERDAEEAEEADKGGDSDSIEIQRFDREIDDFSTDGIKTDGQYDKEQLVDQPSEIQQHDVSDSSAGIEDNEVDEQTAVDKAKPAKPFIPGFDVDEDDPSAVDTQSGQQSDSPSRDKLGDQEDTAKIKKTISESLSKQHPAVKPDEGAEDKTEQTTEKQESSKNESYDKSDEAEHQDQLSHTDMDLESEEESAKGNSALNKPTMRGMSKVKQKGKKKFSLFGWLKRLGRK
ncbi:MAG: hypothetical protein GF315_11350 [candidate division Zixibacteria bacterium]|nr:hypothetical protein [candidate division Zixibacteria bacterium]